LLLLVGVVALSTLAGSTNFPDLYRWAETADLPFVGATLLGLALIAGPTGKCAQFPLHLWLDEAMEGPNPASVLRNSLVVACGAYVLIKLQPVLTISPVAMAALVAIGTVTAVGASLVAIAQIDIKRALSHSTSAYLGLVFIAVGMQWTDFALLIILTHAIAKALLFMSTGCVIAATNSQDLTEMGGLWSRMPWTSSAFVVGAAGLVGLLPLGGFWGMRQGIDEFWFDGNYWLVGILLLVNSLTAFNLTRVFRLAFLGQPTQKTRRAPEVGWQMALPMVILNVTTISVPFMLRHLTLLPEWMYLNQTAVLLLVASGVVGGGLGAVVEITRTWARPIKKTSRFVQDLLAYDFYIDRLYRLSVGYGVNLFSRIVAWIDRYVVDGVVNLVGIGSLFSGESLKYSSSGQTQFHVLTILLGVSLLTALMSWPMGDWTLIGDGIGSLSKLLSFNP
jgi:NAD(P)H-quinone oxidoreductase subunit 5